MCIPYGAAFSRMQPWESKVLVRPSWTEYVTEPRKTLLYTLMVLMGEWRDYSSCSHLRQTSYVSSLLIKSANLVWSSCPLLWSIPAFHGQGQFANQQSECVFLPLLVLVWSAVTAACDWWGALSSLSPPSVNTNLLWRCPSWTHPEMMLFPAIWAPLSPAKLMSNY